MAVHTKRQKSESGGERKKAAHWNSGLLASMDDPALRVEADDKIVIIKDKYPKAKFHYLVLPKESLANLKALQKDHIELLKHMENKGREIAKKCDTNWNFKFGYHCIPSMSHVHLHVISTDFDSPSLKTRRHWNSFTTSYFVNSEDVITQLEKNGKYSAMDSKKAQELLDLPLRCHVCLKEQTNMPKLKEHIRAHKPSS